MEAWWLARVHDFYFHPVAGDIQSDWSHHIPFSENKSFLDSKYITIAAPDSKFFNYAWPWFWFLRNTQKITHHFWNRPLFSGSNTSVRLAISWGHDSSTHFVASRTAVPEAVFQRHQDEMKSICDIIMNGRKNAFYNHQVIVVFINSSILYHWWYSAGKPSRNQSWISMGCLSGALP